MGTGNTPQVDDRLPGEVGTDKPLGLDDPAPIPSEDDDLSELFLEDSQEEPVTPVEPPVVPPTETPAEPEVIDDAKIDGLFAKFKDNPRELAKALLHSQQQISKQGNEIGQLRQQVKPAETPVTPVSTPQVPQQGYDPAVVYAQNPDAFQHTDNGYPIDPRTNQPFLPKDQFGIPFTPRSAWDAKLDEMNEKYPDNPVRAIHEYNEAMAQERAWREQQFSLVTVTIDQQQAQVADTYAQQLADNLAQTFPKEIAAEMVRDFRARADNAMKQYRQSGKVEQDAWEPTAIASAMELAYFTTFRQNQLLQVAEQARARLRASGAVQVPTNGNVPQLRQAINPPPVGNNGVQNRQLTSGVSRLVQGGVIKQEEVDRYLKDDFEFDGD